MKEAEEDDEEEAEGEEEEEEEDDWSLASVTVGESLSSLSEVVLAGDSSERLPVNDCSRARKREESWRRWEKMETI